jgi:hypothetical protein
MKPKNYTRKATHLIYNHIRIIVFSILPNNTKKQKIPSKTKKKTPKIHHQLHKNQSIFNTTKYQKKEKRKKEEKKTKNLSTQKKLPLNT